MKGLVHSGAAEKTHTTFTTSEFALERLKKGDHLVSDNFGNRKTVYVR